MKEHGRRRNGCRYAAILTVICMIALMVFGCGSKTAGEDKAPSGTGDGGKQVSINKNCIYQEELLPLELPMTDIYQMAYGGGRLYLLGDDYNEQTGENATVIASCLADGSEAVVISRTEDNQQDPNTGKNIQGLTVDGQGNLYEVVEEYRYSADAEINGPSAMPDSTVYVEKLDSAGNQLWKTEIKDITYITNLFFASENLFVNDQSEVIIFNAEGKETARVSVPGMDWLSNVFASAGGRVFAKGYLNGKGFCVVEIDPKKGEAGESFTLPGEDQNFNVMAGGGYDLFLWNNAIVAGYNFGDADYTELLNFVDSDIDTANIRLFSAVDEGRFLMLKYNTENWKSEMYALTKVAPEDVKEKQVITFGVLGMNDSELIGQVIRFNKSNDQYRVTFKDYSKYSSEANPEGGITELNNDIAAGTAPDVIRVDNNMMPVYSYIRKGVFEDLYTWLDQDPEMKREDFLTNVLDAHSVDGKLYQIPVTFTIATMFGKTSVVGDRFSWTIDELKEVAKQYPDSQTIELVTRNDLLAVCAMYFGGAYLDYYAGTCSFDSEEFIGLLEWAASFPAEVDYASLDEDYWANESKRYRENETLLYVGSISSFDDFQQIKNYQFGEAISPVGFPVSEGVGSVIAGNNCMAMSAKSGNKEGVWEFIKYFLTKEYQSNDDIWELPVRNDALEELAKSAMEPAYYLDENGNKVEYEQTANVNGVEIKIKPITEQEMDRYLEFIRSVDRTMFYNQDLVKIITEESQSFFAGQKSAKDAADIIQSKASIYMSENQ